MAGYTRQSTFADGDTITAALFNNEYNQLLNAFSNTGGHKHDGTANEGPVIGLIGDAGETSPNNKVLIDTTNNYIEFYVEVSSNPVQQLYIADGAIIPVTDSDVDLGTSSLYFKNAYIDSITTTGNVAVGGNLTVTGTTTFNGGTITMGDAATDNVVFGADVDSNIIPDDDDSYDLGSSSQEWRNLYIDGTANIDSLIADTADINGGTIDGAIIGGSSAAAITGTAITGTSFVIGSAIITEAELEILDGATVTTDELNILDGVTSTAAELNLLDGVTSTTAELNILDGVTASATDINLIDGITNGTVIASKAIITDANKDITGGRNITITGELDAATLDISGNADIDGTLETDALSINGTTVTSTAAELNLLDGKAFLDEDDMSSNSATGIASQQSIKAYVDTQITAEDLDITTDSGTIAIDLDSETLTVSGGTGLDSSATGNAVTLAIDSTVATLTGSQTLTNKSLTAPTLTGTATVASLDISGDIDVDGTTNLDVVDIDGAVDMASTLAVGGVVTANAGVVVDNFTLDGTTLALSSGSITLDSAAQIILDGADDGTVQLHDAGTKYADIYSTSGDFYIKSTQSDKDIKFQGNDGGVGFTALTLDMSDAGRASFNNKASFNNAIAVGQSSFSGGSVLADFHGSGSGVGAQLAFANDHNTDKFYVGLEGNATGDGFLYQVKDADINFYTNNVLKAKLDNNGAFVTLPTAGGHAVFNENGVDADFRVESNSNANLFYVDGGNNSVGIGTPPYANNLSPTMQFLNGGTMFGYGNAMYITGNTYYNNGWKAIATGGGANTIIDNEGFKVYNNASASADAEVSPLLHLTVGPSEMVINNDSYDYDFRIESNDHEYKFFVDAGNNKIGIATSSPAADVHIKQIGDIGNGNSQGLMLESGAGSQKFILQTGRAGVSNAQFTLRDVTNTRDIFTVLDTNGTFQGHTPLQWNNAAVFNENSQDHDFRVESDNKEHMLFVDAGNNRVGINNGSPTKTLSVSGVPYIANSGFAFHTLDREITSGTADFTFAELNGDCSDNFAYLLIVSLYNPSSSTTFEHAGYVGFRITPRGGGGTLTQISKTLASGISTFSVDALNDGIRVTADTSPTLHARVIVLGGGGISVPSE